MIHMSVLRYKRAMIFFSIIPHILDSRAIHTEYIVFIIAS